MPVNRNALIRYRTIDNCLRNRHRKWTLEALIDACSEALYEYEGIDKGVSRRTIQMDIQLMRSDKLGYNAPIVVLENKYYAYEDPEYSITNIPLTDQDLGKLTEVVEILRQFKGFSHFQELSGMVQRLESKIHSAKTNTESVIDFEKNENLKGIEHIDTLYRAIINRKTLLLTYQSFKARAANEFVFYPYYLKEYRNRWFVLGSKKKESGILNLALDRILSIEETSAKYVDQKTFVPDTYFKHVLGVTVSPNARVETVLLYADRETAPYILTKPIHNSQKVVETSSDGTIFSIEVQLNFELEREILGFGNRIKVLAPAHFKKQIKENLENALDQYHYDLTPNALLHQIRKLEYRSFAILQHIYSKREVNRVRNQLYLRLKDVAYDELTDLSELIPDLPVTLLSKNMNDLLKKVSTSLVIQSVQFIRIGEAMENDWKQEHVPSQSRSLLLFIALDDLVETKGAMHIIPGSQNKTLTSQEIKTITQHSIPTPCELSVGGVLLLHPQTLQRIVIQKSDSREKRVLRVVLAERYSNLP